MGTPFGLQHSVDFMEDNLLGEPTLEQIVSASGYSAPHFHRMFRAAAGCSALGYLRRRRLSEALAELVSRQVGILDVAVKYGFGSHEAFTRAFRDLYGLPPSKARRMIPQPPPFERIHFTQSTKRGGKALNPTILQGDPMTLVGICRTMTQAENLRDNLITQVQREFLSRMSEISGEAKPDTCYAVYDYNPADIAKEDDQIRYTYWFCTASDAPPPKGMRRKSLAAARYARFIHDTAKGTLNGEALTMSVYDHIDGVWLPSSGLELSGQPDYEIHRLDSGIVEIMVSVL